MANTQLFAATRGRLLPPADAINEAGGAAYLLPPRERLAQYLMTGTLNGTFYADAQTQFDAILSVADEVDAQFLAKAAIFARARGHMKDAPALIAAILTRKDAKLAKAVFTRVVNNGRMLRNFVQILRSGQTGRKSLGTAPKRLVQTWLENAGDRQLLSASVGQQPSLADVVKMVHPRPQDDTRQAFYGWLIGKPQDEAKLPAIVRDFERFKRCEGDMPDVDFRLLAGLPLSVEQWQQIARTAPWQMTRMNLNTFARHGVFGGELDGVIAGRLRDPEAIRRARAYPHQLLVAHANVAPEVPSIIREALQDALEASLANVPELEGRTWVLVDVSGSMSSPVTGHRRGATSTVRCVDVAGLIAAAVLRMNPLARVIAFNTEAQLLELNPRDSLVTNTGKIAGLLGGGTAVSSALALLNSTVSACDTVVLISDNQSWVDTASGATATMREWEALRQRNRTARLACIDLQPYGTVQVTPRDDVLHVGGFSDAVFDLLASFGSGQMGCGLWVREIEEVQLDL
jgi:60 kDa SS-A/Ro ribonucleoprotein